MLAAMHFEPFYARGHVEVPSVGISLGWTAHEGSAAHDACRYRASDGSLVILAGECRLAATDTNTQSASAICAQAFLDLYRERGDGFLEQLDGLYSGVLVDRSRRRALLFNDRYGVERIYVHQSERGLLFSSEAKALLRVRPELRQFDHEGLAQFLRYGSVLGDRTLFAGITTLPSGSAWVLEGTARPQPRRYFVPEQWESQAIQSPAAYLDSLQSELQRSMRAHVSSPRPVGLSLTGGVDTRLLVATMPRSAERPVSYTFAGATGETSDVTIARRVAAACGMRHDVVRVSPRFLRDFNDHVDKTVLVTDGCAGATTAHEIHLTSQARGLSQVRLTGNFGGEILRGVSTLRSWALPDDLVDPELLQSLNVRSPDFDEQIRVTRAAFIEVPRHLFGSLAAGRSQLVFRSPFLDTEIVKLAYRAPSVCWKSAFPSLALVARTRPELAAIPTDSGLCAQDGFLRRAMRLSRAKIEFKMDYLAMEALPGFLRPLEPLLQALARQSVIGRHKYLPYRTWFRGELLPYVEDVLGGGRVRCLGFLRTDGLRGLLKDHRTGRRNCVREISTILTLEAANRLLLASAPCAAATAGTSDAT